MYFLALSPVSKASSSKETVTPLPILEALITSTAHPPSHPLPATDLANTNTSYAAFCNARFLQPVTVLVYTVVMAVLDV